MAYPSRSSWGLWRLPATAGAPPPPPSPPTSPPQVPATPPAPPSSFVELYNSLSGALGEFEDYLASNWDGTQGGTVFGAELLVANGNRGEGLPEPATVG